jgi:hypothetical protein
MRAEIADDPPAGTRRWLISCDETGVHGARFYGFGSLWMPWQPRGDFAALINALREQHGFHDEAKWRKVTRFGYDFYADLVDTFFGISWLWFHCLLVEKSVVDKKLHGGDYDLARRKHFTMLLTNKVTRALRAYAADDLLAISVEITAHGGRLVTRPFPRWSAYRPNATRRKRPTGLGDSGAARPRFALDDEDLQPHSSEGAGRSGERA